MPTTAITSSTEVSSKANTWSLNRSRASALMLPSCRAPSAAATSSRHRCRRDGVARRDDGGRPATTSAGTDDAASGRCTRERLDREVLGVVDAEQHDHEQEQHDDRAGVDDDLHGGQEVGLLRDEEHGDAEQGEHEAERGVHRVACAGSTPTAPTEHHRRGDDEDEQFHQRGHPAIRGSARRRPRPASARRRARRSRARLTSRPRRRSRRRRRRRWRASSRW